MKTKIPSAGDTYVFAHSMITFANVRYEVGDTLELLSLTDKAPFGHLNPLGNWVVKCKQFGPGEDQCVWAGIWQMIIRGYLVPK